MSDLLTVCSFTELRKALEASEIDDSLELGFTGSGELPGNKLAYGGGAGEEEGT